MSRYRVAYLAVVAMAVIMNGWALLQHMRYLPAHDGFIAAVLLANVLVTPALLWAVFIIGEVAEGERSHRRSRRHA